MGQLDQFGKLVFDEETSAATHGSLSWLRAIELSLAEVRIDGALVVRDAAVAASLPEPWCRASAAGEIVVELKMQGDHVDERAFERGLLRRQALQVVRCEEAHPSRAARAGLWFVAARLPSWFAAAPDVRTESAAPGVYQFGPAAFPLLWIASNELPLRDELVPFLVTRSGSSLVEFLRWSSGRRSFAWLTRVLRYVPMSQTQQAQILRGWEPSDDPEQRARDGQLIAALQEARPDLFELARAEAVNKGRAEGRTEALKSAVEHTCRILAIELDDSRRGRLVALSPEGLSELHDRLVAERRWPD